MASIATLHIARHLLRRAHEDAAKNKSPDLAVYATAHEEICELLGKTDLILTLCHLLEHESSNASDMFCTSVIGSAIGVSHPLILDFKASFSRGVEPQSTSNTGTITQSN